MTRDEVRNLLPQYADGELEPAQAARLEAELQRSPELHAELERWRQLRQCCKRVLCGCELPSGLDQRVRDDLAAHRNVIPLRRFFNYAGLAAAAVLLVAIFWPRAEIATADPLPPLTMASAEPFVNIYRHCAKNHHDVLKLESRCTVDATERIRARLVSENRDCQVCIPDLRSEGFELDGICQCAPKVSCPKGILVVHAFYKRPATGDQPEKLLSVFSMSRCLTVKDGCSKSTKCKSKKAVEKGQFDGVSFVKWNERSGSLALCAELPTDTLESLADRVRIATSMSVAPPVAAAR